MNREEAILYNTVHDALASHPDWLRTVLLAASDGMETAVSRANERAAKLDMGLRCALSLAAPGRLTEDSKRLLNQGVLAALPPDHAASEIERDTRKRLTQTEAAP